MRALKRFNKLQDQCDAWNKANPIGCNVQVTLDSGEVKATTTRSEAEILSGHTAVVWLNGVRGCYLLDRVKPIPTVLEFEGERHTLST